MSSARHTHVTPGHRTAGESPAWSPGILWRGHSLLHLPHLLFLLVDPGHLAGCRVSSPVLFPLLLGVPNGLFDQCRLHHAMRKVLVVLDALDLRHELILVDERRRVLSLLLLAWQEHLGALVGDCPPHA